MGAVAPGTRASPARPFSVVARSRTCEHGNQCEAQAVPVCAPMITLHREGQRRVPPERVRRACAGAGGCAAAATREVEGGTDLQCLGQSSRGNTANARRENANTWQFPNRDQSSVRTLLCITSQRLRSKFCHFRQNLLRSSIYLHINRDYSTYCRAGMCTTFSTTSRRKSGETAGFFTTT